MLRRQRRLRIDEVPAAIARREEFRTGRLHAGFARGAAKFGYLPERYHVQLHEACRDPQTYVIRSSGTPIAWRTFADGWVVPEGLDNIPRSHREILSRVIEDELTRLPAPSEPVG
ncbi:hypothetical protein GS534_24270 [Rhodococcus hoagii]|nr:hypothetical protein [Prescottella equi]NKS33146.1 hypothetical protein [Prescottella equi]